MSAQALTIGGQVVGAVVGGMFGVAPIGAAIGGAVGALAGAALFPPDPIHNEGPRLTGLNVQTSSPGSPIAQIYGAMRAAGSVIWAADITEVVTEEESGGKGGPEITNTTYAYFGDFDIAICEGPIQSLRRIWANGIIYYDITDSANTEALVASGNYAKYFKLYLGSESEEPDPTEEAALGVGNVPGYRGIARIVFTQLPLAPYGNRIPNLEFEVVESQETELGLLVLDQGGLTPRYRDNASFNDHPQAVITEFSGVIRVANSNASSISGLRDGIVRVYDLSGNYIGDDELTDREAAIVEAYGGGGSIPFFCGRLKESGAADEYPLLWADYGATNTPDDIYIGESDTPTLRLGDVIPITDRPFGVTVCVDEIHFIVWTYDQATIGAQPMDYWYLIKYSGGEFSLVRNGTIDASAATGNDFSVGWNAFSMHSSGNWGASVLESDLKHIWVQNGHASQSIQSWSIGDDDVIVEDIDFGSNDVYKGGLWARDGLLAIAGGDVNQTDSTLYIYSRLPWESGGNRTLGGICEDICLRAGFDESELDTDDLTEIVPGYALATQMNARAALELLAVIYQFAAVESDGVLKFAYRNGDSVATIPFEDMGAGTEGSTKQAVIESDRRQETELPMRVNLRYVSVGAMYQIGAQSKARSTTGSREPHTIEAAIAMTDDRAAQAADSILYEKWIGRVTRRFSTLRSWAALEPTDIVTVEDVNADYTVRLLSKRELGAVIEFEAIDVAASVYESNATGAVIPGAQTLAAAAMTRVMLLDIPQLRDADDDAGMYAAAYAYGSGTWSGAVLLRAGNAEGPFEEIASITREGTVGRASSALGSWQGGNVVDFRNTVDVQLYAGTLSSVTRADLFDGVSNAALIGDELIQFETATLLTGTTYRLANLLRARKGTDTLALTHAIGDRFVLLKASKLFRVPVSLDLVGATRFYRMTSFGMLQDNTYDQAITHTGAAITPLPAGNIVAVREIASQDVVIRWHRRARIAAAWRDSVDVALDETSEAYEIDIYEETNTTLLRELTSTTPTVTYTSAQQTADGTPSAFWIRIYQLSDRIGRGFVGQILFGALSDSLTTEGGDPFVTENGEFLVTE